MKDKNFVQAYVNGNASVSDVDNWIEAWHLSSTELSLNAFLGFTAEEGALFAERPEMLQSILNNRIKSA
jgi:hypothetical protein